MANCTDIIENEKVIVNFLEETIVWKVGMFNPKDASKFRNIIKNINNGTQKYYLQSDFN